MPPMLLAPPVFELIGRINTAATVTAAWDIYMAAARDMGLSWGIAFFVSDDRNIGDTTFARHLPDDWLQNYVRQGYQADDPLIRICRKSITPFSWSMADWDGLLSGKQIDWRNDNIAAGIHGGLTIPDRRDGHLKLISLSSKTTKIHPLDQKTLYYAGLETLARMHELGLRDGDSPFQPLSPRERECLNWLAAGKSDGGIGQILSISAKTVATHIDRVKHKLGVATRAQAIVIALRHGILNF